MSESNQGGEPQWVLGGVTPPLPITELVSVDSKRRLLIPKVVRRRLPAWLDHRKAPLDLLCECIAPRRLLIAPWSPKGLKLEGDLRADDATDTERAVIRSRFQKVMLEADARISLPPIVLAHLQPGTGEAQLIGCFFSTHIEILHLADWRDQYLIEEP